MDVTSKARHGLSDCFYWLLGRHPNTPGPISLKNQRNSKTRSRGLICRFYLNPMATICMIHHLPNEQCKDFMQTREKLEEHRIGKCRIYLVLFDSRALKFVSSALPLSSSSSSFHSQKHLRWWVERLYLTFSTSVSRFNSQNLFKNAGLQR